MFDESFFSSLQNESSEELEQKKKPTSPPKNRHEWLERHGCEKWPQEEQSVDNLDSLEISGILGDLHQIKQDLKDHALWDNTFLDNIDSQLGILEDQLSKFSLRFICELDGGNFSTSEGGGIKMVKERDGADKYCDPDVLKALKKSGVPNQKVTDNEKGKTVEQAVYTGFLGDAAPLLPASLEPLQLLDLVTKLQPFSQSFQKFWRKNFFTEESGSFFQLLFWWLWMDKYKPDSYHQAMLFTKMAENFSGLVMQCAGKRKDEFFQKLPPCICQALYTAFCQAFPKSVKQFHSKDFLQWLCNSVYELISGLPSPVECWKEWPMKHLDPSFSFDSHKVKIATRDRQKSALDVSVSLSRSNELSKEDDRYNRSISTRQDPAGECREKLKSESPPTIGPGPTFECVQYGTTSRSPLLQYHMWVHGLTESPQSNTGRHLVTRTQIKELAPPSMTYSELINAAATLSQQRYKEYTKEMIGYKQEIHKAVMDYKTSKREMQREMKRLLQERHEVAIEAEKIMAAYTSQSISNNGSSGRTAEEGPPPHQRSGK